tara:strand:+ start:667 stop:1287 length:621 start_codon:yes stop_codon:yes gene_type:complete
MAIQGGYSVDCGAIQAAGGLKHILIRPWIAGDLITTDLALNQVTRIQDSGGTDADWGVYESEIESSSITINGVNEGKDNTEYECTLSFFLPNLGRNQFRRLQEFQGQCLMVIGVVSNADVNEEPNFVLGVSDINGNVYPNAYNRNQTYARIASIEGGTGAAFSDKTGVTVTITCTQFQLPYTYVPVPSGVGLGIVIGATGMTATTT